MKTTVKQTAGTGQVTRAAFAQWVEEELEAARKIVLEFSCQLTLKPADHFEQSDIAFKAAARCEVLEQVSKLLSSGATLEVVASLSKKQVLMRATMPKRSLSATANIMEQERLGAWSMVLFYLHCNVQTLM